MFVASPSRWSGNPMVAFADRPKDWEIFTQEKTLKDLEELHRKYNIKERDSNRQSGLEYSSNYIIGRNSANEPELITMTYNKTTESSKEPYTAPAIEIIPLETSEPVMQGSFSVPGYGDGSMFPSSSARNRGRNASTSELEDLINDILTIEN